MKGFNSGGMPQKTTNNNASSSLDTVRTSLRKRRRAQIGDKLPSGTPQVDMSRRRQRPQTCTTTTHALPLVVGAMLLLRTSGAFVIQPHTNYLPTTLTRGGTAVRITEMSKRAHNVSPNRHRQHGITTTPPPRDRDFRTFLASTPGRLPEDDSTRMAESKEGIKNISKDEMLGMISSNSTAFNSSAAEEIEETPALSDMSDTSDDAVQANGAINLTGVVGIGVGAQVQNVTFNEVQNENSVGQSDENQPEDEETDERLVQLRQRATAYVAKLPLSQILRRLDKRGLRYGPSSSQVELELMLVAALVSERSGDNGVADLETGGAPRRPKRSDADAYEENDSSNGLHRASRRQSRRRLSNREKRRRRLVQEEPTVAKTLRDVAKAASKVVEPVDRVVSETLWGVMEGDVGNKAKSKVKRVGRKAKRVAVDVAGNVVGGVGDVVDGVKRKGASIRNGNTRVIRVDENGIAEPDWSYVWQEDPDNDGSDTSEDTEDTGQRGRNYGYKEGSERRDRRRSRGQRPQPPRRIVDKSPTYEEIDESEFTWADYAIPFHTPSGPPKIQSGRKRRRRSRQQDPSYEDEISESPQEPLSADGNILALPPASMNGKPFDTAYAANGADATEPSRRRRRSREYPRQKNGTNRKIYSGYVPRDQSAEGDIIDEFGNKIADAAENFLWGEDGGDNPTEQYSRREANARRRRQRRSNRDAAALKDDEGPYEHDLQPKRHWRDRLADRLDAAMGVHEQGSYYQEWADRIEFEEDTKTGDDSEDWVMARHKNQRRMGLTPEERRARKMPKETKPKRRGGIDKYFWTRDGNVMSALLGRPRSGNRAVVDELFSQPLGANVITTLIRSGFQLSLALFTNTCRWASVRGSLPQPIVVFFTGTSLVLAPKGKRFVTTAVTLFALRALAEALHGYIYGPDGWEDDPDHLFIDDDYEDVDFGKDDDDFEPSPPRNRRRRRNSHISSSDDEKGADDAAS